MENLGVEVPQEDVGELADALEKVLYDDDFARTARSNIARLRRSFTWESVLAPLVEFCRDPRTAPDRLSGVPLAEVALPTTYAPVTVRGDLRLFSEYFKAGGVREVVHRARGRVRRITGRGPRR